MSGWQFWRILGFCLVFVSVAGSWVVNPSRMTASAIQRGSCKFAKFEWGYSEGTEVAIASEVFNSSKSSLARTDFLAKKTQPVNYFKGR